MAPQCPLVIVVRGRYFPVGSGPAHTFVAPQALQNSLSLWCLRADCPSSVPSLVAGSPQISRLRSSSRQNPRLQTSAAADLARNITPGILKLSKKRTSH